jgi:Zn-dependent M28 family amino/carboxypeptidase
VGTEGGRKAQQYIVSRYQEIGLDGWRGEYRHQFSMRHRDGRDISDATNLVGVIEGTATNGRYIVITAHFDHLGEHDGKIYNGADDNASGVAGLLAAATYFKANPLPVGLIFAALDAEEGGLRGAHALVAQMDSLGVLESVVMNINMDMISISEAGELYAVGTHHYPFLKPVIEEVAAASPIKLLMGHDTPDLPPGDDWTNASDHAAFHRKAIPFIYFGVEDHPYYHKPEDTFDKVTKEFAVGAAETVIMAIRAFGMMESVGTR